MVQAVQLQISRLGLVDTFLIGKKVVSLKIKKGKFDTPSLHIYIVKESFPHYFHKTLALEIVGVHGLLPMLISINIKKKIHSLNFAN